MNTVTVTFGTAPRGVLRLRSAIESVLACRCSSFAIRAWFDAPSVRIAGLSDESAIRLMDALTALYAGTDHVVELSEEASR